MRRYTYKRKYSWNAPVAYVAGLIASDGCLYNDGRHINLTSLDIDQLEIARSILSLKGTIKTKPNGYGGVGFYIQFSNVAFYDFLYNSGIKPAKSKIIGQVLVPDKFYADFLRGYFDGDGCIYGFWDKRWRSSLMYYTEFTCASPSFLLWLQTQNTKLIGVSAGRIKPARRALSLSYAKEDSKRLFRFMYYSTDVPALRRKHTKFVDLLRSDPYANRALLVYATKTLQKYAAVTEQVDVLA